MVRLTHHWVSQSLAQSHPISWALDGIWKLNPGTAGDSGRRIRVKPQLGLNPSHTMYSFSTLGKCHEFVSLPFFTCKMWILILYRFCSWKYYKYLAQCQQRAGTMVEWTRKHQTKIIKSQILNPASPLGNSRSATQTPWDSVYSYEYRTIGEDQNKQWWL